MKKILKAFLPMGLVRSARRQRGLYKSCRPIAGRVCNCCGYEGFFSCFGRPPRIDALCPSCDSLERHRLMFLAYARGAFAQGVDPAGLVLHFAAEPALVRHFRGAFRQYRTADLIEAADLSLDLESLALPDESVSLLIANHVLEHVDDFRATAEIFRVLRPGGEFVCMVPLVEGWQETYENASVADVNDRVLHFGQGDHVRYYGRDFRDRVQRCGLALMREVTAAGSDVVHYGLLRGEKVFVFQKPV